MFSTRSNTITRRICASSIYHSRRRIHSSPYLSLRLSLFSRSCIAIPSIVLLYTGVYYAGKHFKDTTSQCIIAATIPLILTATVYSGAFIWYGFGTMAKMMGISRYLTESRIKSLAMATMKRKTPAIHPMYHQEKILPSRMKDVKSMVSLIKSLFDTQCTLAVTGMKETGKSTKVQAVVEALKQEGIPTMYIQASNQDGDTFLVDALRAFGIFDEIANEFEDQLEWDHIAGLIENACYEFDQGNVVVIDGVSKTCKYLKNIATIARILSENHRPHCCCRCYFGFDRYILF